jgi:hypothetical protein
LYEIEEITSKSHIADECIRRVLWVIKQIKIMYH